MRGGGGGDANGKADEEIAGGEGGSKNDLPGEEVDAGEELFSSSLAGDPSASGPGDDEANELDVLAEAAAAAAAADAAARVCSLKKSDICLLSVEFLGPRSCCTASLFMPTAMQRLRRHARHWLRCVLSTRQPPSDLDLQTY